MCGIAGFWQSRKTSPESLGTVAARMNAALFHRGPDDGGEVVAVDDGIGLCHRRLSILDLSAAGHQPMASQCGRYIIVFNGEIYNFDELRRDLQARGQVFRGTSDTEVLLEGIAAWGVRQTLERGSGMFALAIWDRQNHKLTLARDHLGIKPLYYGWSNGTFLFGSELKALHEHPDFVDEVNYDSVALLLHYNYIPAPHSIWKNIYKLPAGHFLELDNPQSQPQPEPYWSVSQVLEKQGSKIEKFSDSEAMERLESLMRDAVKQQMVADVPLGAFLSGGVDSSAIVGLMQAQSTQRVRTFSIGFRETRYDETPFAARVAQHIGTDHTEMFVSAKDALDVIPRLPRLFDEPFADSSQIPTFLLARLTRNHVKVSLSGDGGDELFAGYTHYLHARQRWHMLGLLPRPWRHRLSRGFHCLAERICRHRLIGNEGISARLTSRRLDDYRMERFARALNISNISSFYQNQVCKWLSPTDILAESHLPSLSSAAPRDIPRSWDVVDSMTYFDLLNYLPEDILTKVDRASMAVSLEARVPFLDYRLVEFALQLPIDLKIRQCQGKWLLRKVLHKYVPPELVERPKMGFRVPVAAWLRGPLRDWAEDLLSSNRLTESALQSEPIRQKWKEHLLGQRNWEHLLWGVLMYQSWRQTWLKRSARKPMFQRECA